MLSSLDLAMQVVFDGSLGRCLENSSEDGRMLHRQVG